MIRKFHRWLIAAFLPEYAHQVLREELEKTRRELADTKARLREEKAYSRGLEYALRHTGRAAMTVQGAKADAAQA